MNSRQVRRACFTVTVRESGSLYDLWKQERTEVMIMEYKQGGKEK